MIVSFSQSTLFRSGGHIVRSRLPTEGWNLELFLDMFMVCLLVTTMNCGKTAGPIEMPFGMWGGVGPSNHVLDRGLDTPGEGAILGDFLPIEKHCQWQPGPFFKLLWPLVHVCKTFLPAYSSAKIIKIAHFPPLWLQMYCHVFSIHRVYQHKTCT